MAVSDKIRHLKSGDALPTFQENHLTLYSVRFSPFAERARLVLNVKHIPFNVINVHIRNKPEWFLQRNPLGKVPTLEEADGAIIYESLVLCEYLDDKYPGQEPLLPRDAYERAAQKQLIETIIQTAAYKHTLLDGDPEAKITVENGLDAVEKLLNTPFWAGPQFGFVDLMVWPWFERLPAIRQLSGLDFSAQRHPKICRWMENMLTIPGVKATAYSTEDRVAFLETRKRGAVDFDVGL